MTQTVFGFSGNKKRHSSSPDKRLATAFSCWWKRTWNGTGTYCSTRPAIHHDLTGIPTLPQKNPPSIQMAVAVEFSYPLTKLG